MTARESLQGIAIIGMAGRFPGAKDLDEFWQALCQGAESVRSLTEEELKAAGVDPALLCDPFYVKRGAVVEDADLFDAAFFDMVAAEAEVTDPQHRLFLECAHQAFEDAGYDPKTYPSDVGVFGGAGRNTYINHLYANPERVEAVGNYQALIGNDPDHLATRVAYKLNLRGPALTVQTACSTSLVAVHLACQSLLTYECDMALAGGVAIKEPQTAGYLYQEGGILSPDGSCRAFDAGGQGTVVGNGAGVVLLKRLDEALADGDRIYAVIRGSAINNDGSQKVGYTAPSVERQAAVIQEALAVSGVEAETISYVEAHGTGTPLGDPIELAALTQAFRAFGAEQTGFCAIGSVKTNIGHLDAAAGVAGLIKTVLSLQHRALPPTLHVAEPNPQIDFASSPFYLNTSLRAWDGVPARRAGVSSFGLGGTNAHLILEEAPQQEPSDRMNEQNLLVLSAKTETALSAAAEQLADYLAERKAINLSDVAYTLQVGRTLHPHRLAVVCGNVEDAVVKLREQTHRSAVEESAPPFVVFLFSGQGAQYVDMGRELYARIPAFRQEIDSLAQLIAPSLGADLRSIFSERSIEQTEYAQPALFAFSYALAKLWAAWGVRPDAMIGHSIGEYVAAVLAGVMSLEDALELVVLRGRLMQGMPPGAMLAVALGAEEVERLLAELWSDVQESAQRERLAIASVNGPASTVVAGTLAEVEKLEAFLGDAGISSRRLATSHAFHSAMMEPMLAPFAEAVAKVTLRAPQQPYLSNLSGTWITAEEAVDPRYYVRHLRETVRFDLNVAEVLKQPDCLFLEVGPGRSLSALLKGAGRPVYASTRHREEAGSDVAFLLRTAGQLLLHGVKLHAPSMYAGESRRRVALPTYPFERKRYHLQTAAKKTFRTESKLPDLSDWFYLPVWKRSAPILEVETATEWLVFLDSLGLGERLVQRLRAGGATVYTVSPGAQFAEVGDGHFTLNPQLRADYDQLLRRVDPSHIVQLWSLTGEETGGDLQDLGVYSLLSVAQTLGELKPGQTCRLFAVTASLQDVTDDEVVVPERATLLGPIKVIPQEYPHLICRSIDLLLKEGEERQIEQLIEECTATAASESIVAYRGKYRYVPSFEKARLTGRGQTMRLRQNGVYLLTGAGQEVGRAFAQYLATSVQAKLVLIAPPEAERPQIEGEHLFFHADVADEQQMSDVLTEVRSRLGEVHGVIHAEDVFGSGLIQWKTREMVERVLRPKLVGTRVLQKLFAGHPLDFFALFSRTISFTGGFGQVDNAAGNAFLDAFVRSETNSFVISWSGWQFDAWQAAQTMIHPQLQAHLQELQLRYGLTAAEGCESFERILGSGISQVIVSTQDFQSALEELSYFHTSVYLETIIKDSGGQVERSRPFLAPRNAVERTVAELWQELFGLERVSVQDHFFELGGNSLLGAQLVARLRSAFRLEVPMSVLFESPTVEALANRIVEQQMGQTELEELERMLQEIEALSAEEIQAKLTNR